MDHQSGYQSDDLAAAWQEGFDAAEAAVERLGASAKVQARAALDRLDRDAAWFVLGALTESAPEDFLKAVRLYQTVLGTR